MPVPGCLSARKLMLYRLQIAVCLIDFFARQRNGTNLITTSGFATLFIGGAR